MEKLQRPTPKVYDADGVPCNENETVFDIHHGAELQIKRLTDDRRILCEYGDGLFGHYLASEVTHERPVFDAEGVRICKGDTVWDVNTAERIEVKDLNFEAVTQVHGIGSKSLGWYYARSLTNREPDSLEKLQDFLGVLANRYSSNVDLMSQLDKAYDMCTALIERGA